MNLDMNCDHYTDTELEALYRIDPGYTIDHILDGERKLYQTLVRSVPDMQVHPFLKQVTKRLFTAIEKREIDKPIEKREIEKPIEKREIEKPDEPKKTYVFTVDSMYRPPAYKIHDFVYTLPEPIIVLSLQIECIDIPVLWNEFNKAQFFFNNLSIPIPDGSYTTSEMEKILYEASSLDVSIQQRTVIRYPEPFTIDFGKRFKSAGWVMGFRREQYKSIYNVLTSNHEIESEAQFGNLTECMYVDVYDYGELFIPDKKYENHSKYVMGYFPVVNQQRVHRHTWKRTYSEPVKLERLRIQLFNKFGEPFLNEADFCIHFAVQPV